MKHLFNKLSAFIVMLMCVSATAQAEIVHHEVCEPTLSSRGFTRECWENSETGKIYSDANCTQEITGANLVKAVTYAELPTSPISKITTVHPFETYRSYVLHDYNFKWGTYFDVVANLSENSTASVEFEVKEENPSNVRLVWAIDVKRSNANSSVQIYVNETLQYDVEKSWYSTLLYNKFVLCCIRELCV